MTITKRKILYTGTKNKNNPLKSNQRLATFQSVENNNRVCCVVKGIFRILFLLPISNGVIIAM
jgi:hypothetical protein